MASLRSLLFNALFYLWALVMNLAFLPGLLMPRKVIVFGQRKWSQGNLWLLRVVAGTRFELRGAEHLPKGAALIAAKHQSAFDTMIFHVLLSDPAMVLKKELLSLPIYGWYCRKTEMIAVDRKGKAAALKDMVAQARRALGKGRQIVIFPEGTRSAPDSHNPYQPGIAALYAQLDTPVVPVALNSGIFWPRRKFLRLPGTIVVEFLPPVGTGLKRKEFMAELENRIEGKSRELVAEARAQLKAG